MRGSTRVIMCETDHEDFLSTYTCWHKKWCDKFQITENEEFKTTVDLTKAKVRDSYQSVSKSFFSHRPIFSYQQKRIDRWSIDHRNRSWKIFNKRKQQIFNWFSGYEKWSRNRDFTSSQVSNRWHSGSALISGSANWCNEYTVLVFSAVFGRFWNLLTQKPQKQVKSGKKPRIDKSHSPLISRPTPTN